MKKYIKSTLILLGIMSLSTLTYSQSTYSVKQTEDVDIKLLGTSTVHDWEMEAKSSAGEAQFVFKAGSEIDLVSITSLSFVLKVADLKSDNKGLDDNAYTALKSEKYKDICYTLTSSTLSPEKEGYLIKSTGNLTIAGVTKEILMDVHCVGHADGTVTSTGSYKLKMSDYDVKAPSFMWGAMKTGDALTLDFQVVYKKYKGA